MSSDTVSTVKPYDAQRHKLEYGWNEAKDIYRQSQGAGPYQGKWYAGLNDTQNGAMGQFAGFLDRFTQPQGSGGGQGYGGDAAPMQGRAVGQGAKSQATGKAAGKRPPMKQGDFSKYATLPGQQRGKPGANRAVGPEPVMVGFRPKGTVRGYGTGAAAEAPQPQMSTGTPQPQGALAQPMAQPQGALAGPMGQSQPGPQMSTGTPMGGEPRMSAAQGNGGFAGPAGSPAPSPQMSSGTPMGGEPRMSPSQAMTPPPAQSGASMGGEPPMAYSQGQPQQPQMSGGSPQDALLGAAFANAGAGASYGSNAQNVYDRYGSQDATGGIMGRLGQYMQDPNLEASIGAAKSDIYRDLKENGLTQLDGDAAMNGNVNSSRTGVAEGLLKRGAMDRAAQVDAGMRENAYTRALGAAQEDYFGGARTAMEANNQVGQAFQMGQQGMMGALGFGNALYQGQMGMGNVQQQDAQNRLNANRQQYEYLNGGYQNNALNQYLGQTGGQQWGSASAKPNTGLGQSVAGGALAGFGAGGPWGAVLGGGLGALGSLF